MRLDHRVLWMTWIALAALGPLAPADGQEKPEPDAAPAAAAKADEEDTRLSMEDIQHMRRQRMSPEQVVENVAERGRDFEVTEEVVKSLRRLGFRPAQIDAIKEAPSEPLVPGQSLSTSDEEREETLKELKLVAVKSRAKIKPIESQHVTLWAAEDAQQTYLRDVQKLEKFYHTRCAEPLRCGLDKRSTHVVVLKDHAEYHAWCQAMFDLFGKQFEQDDNPNAGAHFREEILKLRAFYWRDFCAISAAELPFDWARRYAVGGVASMYIAQLANPPRRFGFDPLQTGFVNGAENVVFGSPSLMFSVIAYGQQTRSPAGNRQAWSLLVQQRMATQRATPLGELLKMDSNKMLQPHYAEAWTLVGLLSKQPVKFGKLLQEISGGASDLEAIKTVYGWDEQQLTKEWHAYVAGRK